MSFPRYPACKDSGVEWLGKVPEYWEGLRLRFAATLNPSKQEARSYADDDLVTFLPMEAIGEDGSLNLEQVKEVGECLNGYTYFKEGDVCIAKITPCFENGKGAILRGLKGGIGFGTTELIVARPTTHLLLAKFLDYLFRSNSFRSLGEAAMYGAGGQKRVPEAFVRDFRSFIPPLTEQQQIISFLDRETAKIDALIAEQQRLIELLQEKRQAVISHAVTKGLNPDAPMKDSGVEWLGEVPEHWEVAQLNQLINKITNGYVGPTRDILQDEGIRYLQSLHIKNNKILFETPYYVSEEWSATKEKSILKEGDVLIVQTGDIGQSAVVTKEFEGCNCHALIVVAPRCNVLTGAWLSWVLNSAFGKETLLSIQTGALHPHLNCGNVKYISIPVSPIEEQTAICNYIAAKNLEADELICASCKSIELMKERRSALISAAVTGQIDVRGLVPEASAA